MKFLCAFVHQVLYSDEGAVTGIATNDMGIAKDGTRKESFQRGMELRGEVLWLFRPLERSRSLHAVFGVSVDLRSQSVQTRSCKGRNRYDTINCPRSNYILPPAAFLHSPASKRADFPLS